MEKMIQIGFEIEGVSPLKMDMWLDNEKQPKNEQGYIEQAKKKAYRDTKGNLSIPANAIEGALRFASSEVGKKMEAKKNRQTIKSAVFIEPVMLSLGKKDYDDIAKDIVERKGQGDKVTRVPTFRPLIKSWKCSGVINTYAGLSEFLKECMELAGMRYGLLGHRPKFGRFILTKWEVKK